MHTLVVTIAVVDTSRGQTRLQRSYPSGSCARNAVWVRPCAVPTQAGWCVVHIKLTFLLIYIHQTSVRANASYERRSLWSQATRQVLVFQMVISAMQSNEHDREKDASQRAIPFGTKDREIKQKGNKQHSCNERGKLDGVRKMERNFNRQRAVPSPSAFFIAVFLLAFFFGLVFALGTGGGAMMAVWALFFVVRCSAQVVDHAAMPLLLPDTK